ncbi:hypothetical protein ALC57_08738 [Trachymyrmex cornetzi]|uniref:CCHC-type domain-containing protein n=1 Tax=Trachymyrmex cornetzi TaxID=471704 RepID=A0A195E167_9HYME|nr:hypothetical protein ALC57_08738 [Trachymyrmex cornetzi]
MVEKFHRQFKAAIKSHETERWTEVLLVILLGIRAAWREDLNATEQNFDIYKKKNNFTFDEKKETRRKHFNSQSGKEEKTENKFNKFNKNNYQKKIRNERTKECWECGKEGHFRSECPGRTENEK